MKMSEVFELPAKQNDSRHFGNIVYTVPNDKVIFSAESVKYAEYITNAINNHDRLASENARLLDMLKRLTSHDNCRKDVIHLMIEADSLIEELEKGDE